MTFDTTFVWLPFADHGINETITLEVKWTNR